AIDFISAERLTPAGAPEVVTALDGRTLSIELGTVAAGSTASVGLVLQTTAGGEFEISGQVTCSELADPVIASAVAQVDVENRVVQLVTQTSAPPCGVLGGATLMGLCVVMMVWSRRRR